MTNNQINYWNMNEGRRHNKVTEGETNRHNVAVEGETARHNRALEGLEARRIELGYAQLSETVRSNKNNELIKTQANVENARHNLANENITGKHYEVIDSEAIRHNVASEMLDQRRLMLDQSKQILAEEQFAWTRTRDTHQIVQGYMDEVGDLIRAGSSMYDAHTRASEAKTRVQSAVNQNKSTATRDAMSAIQFIINNLDLLAAAAALISPVP